MWISPLLRLLSFTLLSFGLCLAEDPECVGWANQGECEENPGYMLNNCAEACKEYQKLMEESDKELASIKSFYDLQAKDIDGNVIDFNTFKGKVVIITNVASYCGYTESHYKGLVELHKTLVGSTTDMSEILAFPCNQFGAQEPEPCSSIKRFAENKGVKFTMMDKIDVNGPSASIVYKYLKKVAGPSTIEWNFATYYVISPDGEITSYSGVEPMELKDVALALMDREEL